VIVLKRPDTTGSERWTAFDRLALSFLPVHPGFEAEAGRLKARFILLSNLVTTFLSFALLIIYAACGLWWSFGGVLLYVAFSMVVPLLQRYGVPFRGLFAATFSLVLLAVAMAALSERPLTAGVLAWACIIPLTALYFFGLRSGAVWTLITVASMSVVVWLMPMNLIPTTEVPMPHVFQAVRFLMVLVALLGFAVGSELNSQELLERAKAANEAKSTFLANISHEIRTPLNGVMGMTEVMLLDEQHPERREQLDVVKRSGRLLLNLIDELLDVTRAERGELTMAAVTFELRRALVEVHALHAPQAKLRGVNLKLELPEELPSHVSGDDFRLRQLLGNLVGNALKFTSQGTITLRLTQLEGERWRFEVEDTGIGISAEALGGLFTPFKQAEASTARRFGGTGLGLALVRLLATGMGGEVHARSEPGVGSVFTVELPLPVRKAPSAITSAPMAALAARMDVLVVDDNAVNLRIASALLQRAGCLVSEATNGQEAVDLASAHPFTAIFMDCQMPVLDGLAATRQLRANPATALVPIIALTASAMADEVAACMDAGMNEVMAKPITFDGVRASLERYSA
jgi:signal transduction histidine kinase/ActR/RegA family two-component response regulator